MAIKRFALAALAVLIFSAVSSAQLEWDKKHPLKRLPNPNPVSASRDDIVKEVKALFAKNQIPVKSENLDETRGIYVLTSDSVVFARGIVAPGQFGHFADTSDIRTQSVIRGRVTIRVEIAPTTPTSALVGVYGTFEGLRQGPNQGWISAPSRGLLEDKILKHVMMDLTGATYGDDVLPDEDILGTTDQE